ncbi:Palmitoyltransferase [Aphelenchoides besseyi]|nr:Palmitoyltransferase [Aphelenchoides besseyi]
MYPFSIPSLLKPMKQLTKKNLEKEMSEICDLKTNRLSYVARNRPVSFDFDYLTNIGTHDCFYWAERLANNLEDADAVIFAVPAPSLLHLTAYSKMVNSSAKRVIYRLYKSYPRAVPYRVAFYSSWHQMLPLSSIFNSVKQQAQALEKFERRSPLIVPFGQFFKDFDSEFVLSEIVKQIPQKLRFSATIHKKREQADDEDDYDSGSDYDFVTRKKHFVGEDWTICSRCESYRPPRAHHCRICKRCIRKMDHHCPWVNNCVGEFNQKYFLQFVFYVGILALYAVGIVVLSWIYHDENSTTGQNGPNGELARHYKVIHTVCLSIEASLLGLFVLAVSCDQLQAIFNDETIIEAIQRRTINRRRQLRHGKWALLRAVCGERHWSLWALPCFSLTHRRDFVHFAKPFKDLSV